MGENTMILSTIHLLHEIAQRCLTGEPLEAGSARWLGGLLDDFLAHRVDSFEDAMGLAQDRGGMPWWLELAIRKRDAALRELAARFLGNATVRVQARRIEMLALRYAESCWQADRSLHSVPQRYVGTPNEWLWLAFHSGARMPIGERQLRSILPPMRPKPSSRPRDSHCSGQIPTERGGIPRTVTGPGAGPKSA
jgi:hypothetical protein